MSPFNELFRTFLERSDLNPGQLANLLKELATPMARETLYNWSNGKTKRPRYWRDIVVVARALNLAEVDASDLLRAAGHPAISELRGAAKGYDATLLQYWDVPFQEIEDLPHFSGRQREIDTLIKALSPDKRTIVVIHGMAGVGKTTLAARVAHLMRHKFPDGILWANLEQSNSMTLLSSFVRPYGEDVSEFTNLEDRSRVVRDILARKRVLMVLDDVQDDRKLAALLPAGEKVAVLITTRRQDLWWARHAFQLALAPFDEEREESLQLLAHLLDEETCTQERKRLREIARAVGHLPLAVDIIGNRLAAEPGMPISRFHARLQQEKRRLDLLKYNQELGVRLSFNISYEALAPDLQQIFITLGAFDGEDFDVAAAGYVNELAADVIHDHLTRLYMLSLLQTGRTPDRFRLHPLLRDFGRERMQTGGPVRRMIRYYVDYTVDSQDEFALLDIEYSNLEAALRAAWEHEEIGDLVRGANALYRYWEARGLYETAALHLEHAQEVAQRLDEPIALVQILHKRGRLAVRQGDYRIAEKLYGEGLELAQSVDAEELVCALQQSLGALMARQGKMALAEQWTRRALALAETLGDADRRFNLRNNLGGVMADSGQLSKAQAQYEQALALVDLVSGGNAERRCSILLQNLGRLCSDQGDSQEAYVYYQRAWELAEAVDDQARLCGLLDHMGYEAFLSADYERAKQHFLEGLRIARHLGAPLFLSRHHANQAMLAAETGAFAGVDRRFDDALQLARDMGASWDICFALNRWGDSYLCREEWELATEKFEAALVLADESGFSEHVARATFGLAQAAAGLGLAATARQRAQKSLRLFQQMEHRMRRDVGQWLESFQSSSATSHPKLDTATAS